MPYQNCRKCISGKFLTYFRLLRGILHLFSLFKYLSHMKCIYDVMCSIDLSDNLSFCERNIYFFIITLAFPIELNKITLYKVFKKELLIIPQNYNFYFSIVGYLVF